MPEEVYHRPTQTYPGCFGLPYQVSLSLSVSLCVSVCLSVSHCLSVSLSALADPNSYQHFEITFSFNHDLMIWSNKSSIEMCSPDHSDAQLCNAGSPNCCVTVLGVLPAINYKRNGSLAAAIAILIIQIIPEPELAHYQTPSNVSGLRHRCWKARYSECGSLCWRCQESDCSEGAVGHAARASTYSSAWLVLSRRVRSACFRLQPSALWSALGVS